MVIRWLVIASLLVLSGAAGPLNAAVFVVDSLVDANDAAPGDGVCDVGSGVCSFRAAVEEANASPGADRLELIAGIHELFLSNTFGLLKPSLETSIEVVGAGAGQTILFADVPAQNGMVDVFLGSDERVSFSNLTFDVQTGKQAIIFTSFGTVPPDGLLLEDMEILANTTVPTLCCGATELIDATGPGQITLRRAFVQTQRLASNGFVINARHNGGLVIEDSVFDGGSQYRLAVLVNLLSGQGGPLFVSDSVFRNFDGPPALFGDKDAVFYLRPFNTPGQALIERTTVEDSFRAATISSAGAFFELDVIDSLFANLGSGLRLSGPAEVTMTNSTISGGGTGVALVAPESGGGTVAMALNNSTVTGAAVSVSVEAGQGTLTARNSIIANGTTECAGTLTSAGFNLVEGSCTIDGDTTGNIIGSDPILAALTDNGGPTRTHALEAGSPAVDAADDSTCPATDQRGYSRPADGDGDTIEACDMGAFEKDAVFVMNNPPEANDDSAMTDEDQSVPIDVAGNDTDTDGDLEPTSTNIECGDCSTTTRGTLENNADGTFLYTPDGDIFGQDSFSYEICDSKGACDTATVEITILAINDAPTFVPGNDPVFPGGSSGFQSLSSWIQSFDAGPNENQLIDSYTVSTTDDPDGVLSGPALIDGNGSLEFTLTGNSGTAQLEAIVTDDGGVANGGEDTSAPNPFAITVGAVEADLEISILRCSNHAAPERPYTYGLRVQNAGPDAAVEAMITHESLPGAVVTLISSPDCQDDGDSVECSLGTVPSGSDIRIGLSIETPDVAEQILTMSASVTTSTNDPRPANDQAQTQVKIIPDLLVSDRFQGCARP